MALIPQQNVIKVTGSTDKIIELLNEELDSYPEVKIISISVPDSHPIGNTTIFAVVETI